MTSIAIHGLGVRSHVTVVGGRSAEVADAVRAAWSRCLSPRGGELEGGHFVVHLTDAGDRDATPRPPVGADEVLVSDSDLAPLLQRLTQEVTTASITAQRGRLFMFHAGAVTDPASGDTLAFVAPGGTGKTTLARTLGRTHGYVTDETVGLTPEGRVVPYEKPLSVRPDPFAGVKVETSPDELGLARPHPDAHLRRFVLIRREEDRSEPAVETLDTVDALLELATESSSLSSLDRPLHTLAGLLEARRPTLLVRYAEARHIRELLLAALAER